MTTTAGTEEQVQRQTLENYVNNCQNLFDIGVSRALTRRVSVSVAVPFVNSSWALRDPAYPFPAPRVEIPQHGRGLGDITVTSGAWLFRPQTHRDWNISAGGGLKPDRQLPLSGPIHRPHRPRRSPALCRSVGPARRRRLGRDAGGAGILGGEAHLPVRIGQLPRHPKDRNDTPSIIAILGLPTNTCPLAGLDVNSVPDQYLARVGGAVHVWRGLSAALAWRVEGLRRYDLLGRSHGWRRPGTEMFVEPGVSYTQGQHTVTLSVPVGY